jgi:hypothetical protein
MSDVELDHEETRDRAQHDVKGEYDTDPATKTMALWNPHGLCCYDMKKSWCQEISQDPGEWRTVFHVYSHRQESKGGEKK